MGNKMAIEVATCALSQVEIMDCPIAKLADEDLAAIFKHLPPFERLIVSEVCHKWRDISQTPWRDVTCLDLSQVPTQNIHAVIKKCPNLSSVCAQRQNLGDLGRFALRLRSITSLQCVECTFTVDRSVPQSIAVDAPLRSACWSELIWHKSKILGMNAGVLKREHSLLLETPRTLRRLQMSGLTIRDDEVVAVYNRLRQPQLECLVMTEINWQKGEVSEEFLNSYVGVTAFELLATATNLLEVYFDAPFLRECVRLLFALPRLQIVFLTDIFNINFEQQHLKRLLTQHRSLRVVVITASRSNDFNGEITIPVRKLFPNGFNAPAVPRLHLFLDKIATEKLRFHPSPTDALKVYPIDAPLPQFLEKEEIKPIFEGSWIASRIKEGAKEGVNLADYEGNAESIQYASSGVTLSHSRQIKTMSYFLRKAC